MKKSVKVIIKDYISSIGKVIFLIALCFVLGFAVIFPLWKWATVSPKVYSFFILACVFTLLVYFLIKKFLNVSSKKTFIIKTIKLLELIIGLSVAVLLIYAQHRIISLIVLVATIFLYVFLSILQRKYND